jgi:vault protein inter-alpha-trypsin-like protein
MLQPEYKPLNKAHQSFNLFAGVIMPVISITMEATTHICAKRYFDPIPSVWHLLLVIFVPVAQLHVWFIINRGTTKRLGLAGWLNALSLGVAIFYSFVFIPFLPLAALPIVGLFSLPALTPPLSLVAAIVQRHQLKQISARAPQKFFIMRTVGLLTGLVLTAACIGLLELPAARTRYGLKLATSEFPETRATGIHFLREFGSREYLLRLCYGRKGEPIDFLIHVFSTHAEVTSTDAQQIYYRVTGEHFNTSLSQDEFDFDSDQNGVKSSGTIKGLSLSKSRIYTKADADGGIAYTEWTLVFLNESVSGTEARAEVQLPPGAVVSRLTLWTDGAEREATFADRSKVNEAYQQLRSPVAVTTSGRDRILVQCFPVPAGRGEMKIRIGITIPLLLEDLNNAKLLLPYFIDRNFRIPDEVAHSVRVESKTSISSASSAFMKTDFTADMFAHRGRIPEREMSNPRTTILIARRNVAIWSKDPFQSGNFMIQQNFEARRPKHLYRLVLVVDTSAATPDMRDELIAAFGSIPAGFDFKLVLANADGISHNVAASGVREASAFLSNATFGGGADNVPALLKAWDLATEKPGNNAIVWVHGPQVVQLQPAKELRWRWTTEPYGPSLYSLQTRSGPDQILKTLDGIDEVKSVARTNEFGVDFQRLLQRLTGQMTTIEWIRTSKKVDSLPYPNAGIQTSDELARLWANDEITRILAPKDKSLNEAATMLAARYQLVTPVTGAVILDQ